VLSINYRLGIGYGYEFHRPANAGAQGASEYLDVKAAAEYLRTLAEVDQARIGIYGGSYGGYATLAGVTFTPDLYACGVDYVGVSNIFTWMNAFPEYWKPMREMVFEMVGDPEKDKELLQEVSPYFHADKIVVPMLIAQGANDPRVNKAESDQMVEALRGRGIEVEYIVKDNEGHGFSNEENRFDFYGAMERFLGKHLGGSVEPAPAPGAEG
jgi:dipeptidyl aminopeptidase/acylaminoacyl peptidase